MNFSLFQKILLFLLISLGTLSQSLVMIRSGLNYSFGMGFWGANGHDGVWHLALINQALRGFPPPHPTMAGEFLTNYHYFYDLMVAVIQALTKIPAVFLYFRLMPLLLSFLLGIFSFAVGYGWKRNFWVGFWLTFLNYFGGSFGFIVTLARSGEIGGESLFWSMQSGSAQINPPFALSLVLMLGGILLLLKIRRWNLWKILFTAAIFGLLVNVKVYSGIVSLIGLTAYACVEMRRKRWVYGMICLLAWFISTAIFLAFNRNASSLLVFQPLWFVHTMIESTDRLYLPRLALARYYLLEKGIGWRLLAIEVAGIILFFVGNAGSRIIGFCDLFHRFKKLNGIDCLILAGVLAGGIIPLLFIQRGTAWNTIQFFYYFLFFLNFFAASALATITCWRKKIWGGLAIFFFLLMTWPSSYGTLKNYLGWPPPAVIPPAEIRALEFLKKQKDGVILTYPYDRYAKTRYFLPPIDLKDYESTGYVSAMTGKQTFLEDTVNLDISGYQWEERGKEVEKFFSSRDNVYARGFLLNDRIGYIYLAPTQSLTLTENDLGIEAIYDQDNVRIYRVRGTI